MLPLLPTRDRRSGGVEITRLESPSVSSNPRARSSCDEWSSDNDPLALRLGGRDVFLRLGAPAHLPQLEVGVRARFRSLPVGVSLRHVRERESCVWEPASRLPFGRGEDVGSTCEHPRGCRGRSGIPCEQLVVLHVSRGNRAALRSGEAREAYDRRFERQPLQVTIEWALARTSGARREADAFARSPPGCRRRSRRESLPDALRR